MENEWRFSRGWCSPQRYVQGPGEFERIVFYTDKFGKRVVAFIDQFLFDEFTGKLNDLYKNEEHNINTIVFDTEVTKKCIDRCTNEAKAFHPDVILGIGGGKTIDVSKAVGIKLNLPFIILPTIAATDSATSSLSVIYKEDGSHEGEFFYDRGPDILVVDSKIIAAAPVRFLISGMGDALATLIEADSTRKSNTPNLVYHIDGGRKQTIAGQAIAKACYDSLLRYGVLAKASCEQKVLTEALENIIETNILLSGLGFENNATSGAHAINDGLTSVENSDKTMHGEKVAFGCIVQLVAESAAKEYLDEVLSFCLNVGLPVCLDDLNVEASEENFVSIAKTSLHSNWKNMPFDVNFDVVYAALKTAHVYGKMFKEEWQKNN